MTRETNENTNAWYFNFYISQHICNNKQFFSNLFSKSYEFIIARGDIIRSKEIGSINLSTQSRAIINLNSIAYILQYDFNWISLSQLQESGITYHDHPNWMILKEGENIIRSASRHRNLFALDIKSTRKTMIIQERGQPNYL